MAKEIDPQTAVQIVKQLGIHHPQILIEMSAKVGAVNYRKEQYNPQFEDTTIQRQVTMKPIKKIILCLESRNIVWNYFKDENIIRLESGTWGYKHNTNIWFKNYEGETFATKEQLLEHINNGYTLYLN